MFLTLQIPAIPGDACPIATQALIYGLGFPPSLTLAMNTDEIFNDAGKKGSPSNYHISSLREVTETKNGPSFLRGS